MQNLPGNASGVGIIPSNGRIDGRTDGRRTGLHSDVEPMLVADGTGPTGPDGRPEHPIPFAVRVMRINQPPVLPVIVVIKCVHVI